jgi:tRNA/tmRNA/rRNA uracil-C5-methylase (TrmA/RlmC/RlmD family)
MPRPGRVPHNQHMNDVDRRTEVLIQRGRDGEAAVAALRPAHGTDTQPKETSIRQQRTWSSGDYAVIGTTLQITGETLCEAVDVAAGERVLDVAAGNGDASLAAARRGCAVTATDYVAALLEGTRARAASEGPWSRRARSRCRGTPVCGR